MTENWAKWASEHDQIIKSRLSYGHQANPFHQKRGWPTIGSDLMVIWEMSVEAYEFEVETQIIADCKGRRATTKAYASLGERFLEPDGS